VNFRIVATNVFLKTLGIFVLRVQIRGKKDQQMKKINKIYKSQNCKKKKEH
jgi:hypothetical protein